MRYLVVLMIGVAACGGAKAPETTANPVRGLRPLTMDDPDVTSIAIVAARALPSIGTTSSQAMFSGVYVNGRKARLASDAVARASGFTAISATPRRTEVQCTRVSSSGQSTPIQCPPSVKQNIPPVFSFDEVRATADSAYVGVTESTDAYAKASCVTLVRRASSWDYLGTAVVADAKRCGK